MKKWFFGLLFLIVAVVATAWFTLDHYMRTPVVGIDAQVEVASGASVRQIARQLEAAGVIRYATLFVTHVRLQRDERGLKAGSYTFSGDLSPAQVHQKLLLGQFQTYKITLLEGWTMKQIARYLAKRDFITLPDFEAEFLRLCRDPQRIAALGVQAETLEGFLFPDTYKIHEPQSVGEVVDLLTREFTQRYTTDIAQQAKAIGLSKLEVVTLASIIEKETGAAAERELVSSVFHNRLRKGMRLETDPTIIYGLKNFDGNIRKKDIRNPHRYNTYVHYGLPPGPIASPGEASLRAAVNPAISEFLFFVSRNNGTHKFSKTYREHVNAVNEFQKRRRRR